MLLLLQNDPENGLNYEEHTKSTDIKSEYTIKKGTMYSFIY